MNNRMLDLWADMEARNDMGIAKLLYDPSLPYHIYATYASDERGYGISFTFPDNIRIDTAPFQNLKKLKVGIYSDGTLVDSKMLLIQLLAPAQRDTFSCLCESLINTVKGMDSEESMIKSVISQLDKWRNLFDKAGSEGLSPAEQQGLYGELGFLKNSSPKMFSLQVRLWIIGSVLMPPRETLWETLGRLKSRQQLPATRRK